MRRLFANSINWSRKNPSLVDATLGLSEAKQNLGFHESTKSRVRLTGYALTEDFAPHPIFSNDAPARSAYAVPKHTLPAAEKF
jgi:hypothetical protein